MDVDERECVCRKARQLLHECSTSKGFVAAVSPRTNYRRVWARDGCVCGLAALADEDPDLLDTFEATLRTLASHQGPCGQIPSNVGLDGEVSYGGPVGRVDATIWFVLGVGWLRKVRPHVGTNLS